MSGSVPASRARPKAAREQGPKLPHSDVRRMSKADNLITPSRRAPVTRAQLLAEPYEISGTSLAEDHVPACRIRRCLLNTTYQKVHDHLIQVENMLLVSQRASVLSLGRSIRSEKAGLSSSVEAHTTSVTSSESISEGP